jgi:hypothetical protein
MHFPRTLEKDLSPIYRLSLADKRQTLGCYISFMGFYRYAISDEDKGIRRTGRYPPDTGISLQT